MKLQKSPIYFIFLAGGSFLMAVISFSGVLFLKTDLVGRLLIGLVWSLVSFGWLGQFFRSRKIQNN